MDFHQYVREHLASLHTRREPEIVDELAQHLNDLYTEAVADGLDHDAALARAVAALPAESSELTSAIESASRALPGLIADRWTRSLNDSIPVSRGRFAMVTDLQRDIRYAVRMLLRTPGFTLIVITTMALGIGANAVIFSAIDALLLRSAPVANPDRIVSVYSSNADGRALYSTSSFPDYLDLRDSGSFDGLAAFAGISLSFDAGGETLPVTGEIVTGNFFSVLGVRIAAGRAFTDEEDRPGSQIRVVIVTHEFWTNFLGGDAAVVGRSISLNGNAYTIVGVTPRPFVSPVLGRAPQIYVPMALQPELRPPTAGVRRALGHGNLLTVRGLGWINMVGRLRSSDTVQDAATASAALAKRLATEYPDTNQGRQFTVVRLGEGPGVRVTVRPLLRLLGVAVLIVLLIACANVASLLLARAVSRRRELAVRIAVGAGRGRLMRQWLTEAVLLSLIGATVGLLLAVWGAPMLHTLGIPETIDVRVNLNVLAFTFLVAVGSGVLFGLAPMLQTVRKDTLTALRDEGGAVATGVRAARMRSTLVVAQVALSLILLIGAGLLLRTLQNAYSVDLGYRVADTLLADINLDVRGYSQEAGQAMYARILERLHQLPGVMAAGAARVPVLSGQSRSGGVSADGQPFDRTRNNFFTVRTNTISHGYLDAMGIALLRGRNFSTADTAVSPRVAIVSRSLVNRLWPNGDPIGQTLVTAGGSYQVIGVVHDAVYVSAIERESPPFFYVSLAQHYESGMTLHLRTAGEPLSTVASVRQAVRELDPQIVVAHPRTLEEVFVSSLDEQRLMAALVGLFGAIALILAAVGLYGMMAHLTNQRTAEVGIRLALGARPGSILLLIVTQGLRLVAIGAILGLAGAFAGARVVRNQLFGIAPTDPATFAAVAALLVVVSFVACVLPARRAMGVNPVVALRQ